MNYTRKRFIQIIAGMAVVTGVVCLILSGCQANNPSAASTSTGAAATAGTTTTTSVASGTAYIYLQLGDGENNNSPITDQEASVTVSLILDNVTQATREIKSGFFTFNDLKAGMYTLYVKDNSNVYNSTYQAVEVKDATANNLSVKLVKVSTAPAVSRLDFFGNLINPIDKKPVGFAKIKIGSYETTSLASGQFFLSNITSGTYEVKFEKTGFTSTSGALKIDDSNVLFNQKKLDYVASTSTTAPFDGVGNRVGGYNMGNFEISPDFTANGGLTIYSYQNASKDPQKQDLQPKRSFLFKLFYRKADSSDSEVIDKNQVQTNGEGLLNLDNLPAGIYYAVGLDAGVRIEITQNGPIYIITGTTYSPGLQVENGKTTIMTFIVTDAVAGVDAPALTSPAKTGVYASLRDDVTFSWTGVATTTQYTIRILSAPDSSRVTDISTPVLYDSVQYDNVLKVGKACTKTINLNNAGLRMGYFIWQVGSIDPNTNVTIYSEGREFIIRPSNAEVFPGDQEIIQTPAAPASFTITHSWPPDDTSIQCHVIQYLVVPGGTDTVLSGGPGNNDVTNGVFQKTYSYDKPAAFPAYQVKWKVRYYYPNTNRYIETAEATYTVQ